MLGDGVCVCLGMCLSEHVCIYSLTVMCVGKCVCVCVETEMSPITSMTLFQSVSAADK